MAEGLTGDDGNRYTFFISTAQDNNLPVEGAGVYYNALTFSLWDDTVNISHVYPYLDEDIDTLTIARFGSDRSLVVRLVTVARLGKLSKSTGPGQWVVDLIPLVPKEKNTSVDIQFIRKDISGNRNITVRLYRGKDRPYMDPEHLVEIPSFHYEGTDKK